MGTNIACLILAKGHQFYIEVRDSRASAVLPRSNELNPLNT